MKIVHRGWMGGEREHNGNGWTPYTPLPVTSNNANNLVTPECSLMAQNVVLGLDYQISSQKYCALYMYATPS